MIDPRASILIAGCVLFGALIVAALYPDTDADTVPVSIAKTVETARVVSPAQAVQVEDLLATTLARPLFSSTRRPPEIAQVESSGGQELSDKRLAGIVIEAERRLAIFAVTGGKPLTLSEGESVGGWRIESIAPTEISLVGPSGTRTLQPTWGPSTAARVRPQRNASQRSQPQSGQGAAQGPAVQGNGGAAAATPPRPASPVSRGTAMQNPPDAPKDAPLTPSRGSRQSQRP